MSNVEVRCSTCLYWEVSNEHPVCKRCIEEDVKNWGNFTFPLWVSKL